MTIEQRRNICKELNKIEWISLMKYPDDQYLKNIILDLEIRKLVFWDNCNLKWVEE